MYHPSLPVQVPEYNLNTDILLAITSEGDHFRWHEVNVTPDSMAFAATNITIATALRVCGLDSPVPAVGRYPDC